MFELAEGSSYQDLTVITIIDCDNNNKKIICYYVLSSEMNLIINMYIQFSTSKKNFILS